MVVSMPLSSPLPLTRAAPAVTLERPLVSLALVPKWSCRCDAGIGCGQLVRSDLTPPSLALVTFRIINCVLASTTSYIAPLKPLEVIVVLVHLHLDWWTKVQLASAVLSSVLPSQPTPGHNRVITPR